MLNQTVLLRSTNDSASALVALSKQLFENTTMSYYLHLLDPVREPNHLDILEQQALALHISTNAISVVRVVIA